MKIDFRLRPIVLLFLVTAGTSGFAQEPKDGIAFFENRIRPVLVRECYGCHSGQSGQSRGGLQLDTQLNIRLGGDSGPGVVPGVLEESLLWSALNYEDFEMPPAGRLSDEILRDFQTWIEMGAPDPRITEVAAVDSEITPEKIEEGRAFWSLQPPQRHAAPDVKQDDWPANEVDRFVLSRLEEAGLHPARDADPADLVRRLHFDLIGLPPTPDQARDFERAYADHPQAAVEAEVDRLLADPGFGERWGRHWLDVARYAESTGRELNATFPNAWRYRDYVIDAFNDDLPYDQFIREQIAGDLLPAETDEQWARQLVATGFLTLGPKILSERNGRQFDADLIDEQIDVTTRVTLGLSVACARCHDHKFDPIPQSDYYAMAGIFQNATVHFGTVNNFQNRRSSDHLILPVADRNPILPALRADELVSLQTRIEEQREELTALQREQFRMRQANANPGGANRLVQLIRARNELGTLESKLQLYDEQGDPLSLCMGVQEKAGRPRDARLLVRGELDQPGESVPRGMIQVVTREQPEIPADQSGRLELAHWLTAPNNPLSGRVMANRVWQHLLGNGIVRTPENFGVTGQPPTHPQLLDWLAVEFRESGWSVKELVRTIATSRTYRMSSEFDRTSFERDPDNLLIWRHPPRRLDAESLRDAILAISGDLDRERPHGSLVAHAGLAIVREGRLVGAGGGTPGSTLQGSFRGPLRRRGRESMNGDNANRPRQMNLGSIQLTELDQAARHRSVYLPIIRDDLPRALDVFDFAEPSLVVGQRETSNTPEQALYFLNNEWVVEQSRKLAQQLIRRSESLEVQVADAFVQVYGREATRREMQAAARFFDEYETTARIPRNARIEGLALLCQSLFASAEFRYLE